MEADYDPGKAKSNRRKHGVTFSEALSCFMDERALAMKDPFAEGENRWALVGRSERMRLLTVVYTVRQDQIRLISARRATRQEVKDYAQGI